MTDNAIFVLRFLHLVAASAMFGTWLGIAFFMTFAHRSANPSVVAVTSRFAVGVEKSVMIAAMALQPLSGFPLAVAVGLSPSDQFWLVPAIAIYAAMAACWIAAFVVEIRIRNMTRDAALDGAKLPDRYRRLFRVWSVLAILILAGMLAVFALMVWQPHGN
jgi:uncharacterized membrane protein